MTTRFFAAALFAIVFPIITAAQEPGHGTLEHIKVFGESLAGNLEGDSPERNVIVYLPPGYTSSPDRRYPVIYSLHGYSINAQIWVDALKMPESIERAMTSEGVRGMIMVFPDAQTLHDGSMYSNSVTTGDWETFITRDLVTHVDNHYRTIPERASRGLTGHSMGGYGTVRIAMKHPGTFSSIYAMSSCCLTARRPNPGDAELEKITTIDEAVALDRGARTTFAASAAWAPNPGNPPFYFDLPTRNGEVRQYVIAEWAANAPLAMLPQYVSNLKSLDAIALDVGLQDFLFRDNQLLDELMTRFGITHSFRTYEGDHVNHVADQFEQYVLPFFSQHLEF